jgi:hypothetical protein
MWIDEIVEEVRAIRDTHAARFDYDLDAIYQDLKTQEQHSQRRIVNLPPKCVPYEQHIVTKLVAMTGAATS